MFRVINKVVGLGWFFVRIQVQLLVCFDFFLKFRILDPDSGYRRKFRIHSDPDPTHIV